MFMGSGTEKAFQMTILYNLISSPDFINILPYLFVLLYYFEQSVPFNDCKRAAYYKIQQFVHIITKLLPTEIDPVL